MLHALTDHLHNNPAVIALATYGSTAEGNLGDGWSDLDAVVVLQDGVLSQFFPNASWLARLGEILATEQYDNRHFHLLRVCFTNFQRLDLILVTEQELRTIDQWGTPPPWQGLTVCFARSPAVAEILQQPRPSTPFTPPTPAAFDNLVNQFWFKTAIAVHKIIRNDLLIALHLTLDLVRDCAVLGMMLRDRAAGTNQHRTGGIGNMMVEALPIVQPPYSAASLLVTIAACGIHFDQLANQWSNTYTPHAPHLTTHIECVRNYLEIVD